MLRNAESTYIAERMRRSPLGGDAFSPPRGVRGREPQFRLDRSVRHWRAASVARFTPRMCGACAGERRKFDLIGVGVTGAPRLWLLYATDGCARGGRCKFGTIGVGVTGALRPWPVLCHECA